MNSAKSERSCTILGHCNITIGVILDSLYSQNDRCRYVDIVSNLSDEENAYGELAYAHEGFELSEYFHEEWNRPKSGRYFLSGMGPNTKRAIYGFFLEHYGIEAVHYDSVIHKSAVVCNGVTLDGVVNISPMSVVAHYARLGRFVTLNRAVSVGHHTVIGDFSSVNPGVNIGGDCRIGKGVVIGMGATVFDSIEIGDNAVVGGGAVVTKSVPPNTVVYGVPAKVVKTR